MKRTAKLTDKMVAKLLPDGKSELIVWDTELKGFGIRLRDTGAKTWFFKKGDKAKWSLGDATSRPISEAKAEAFYISSEIAAGRTPPKKARSSKPRVAELMEAYMKDHVAARCDEKTAYDYRQLLDNHVFPALGSKLVDEVVPRDIDLLLAAMKDTPSAANKTIALIKAAFAKGMRWGIRTPALGNPCTGAQMFETKGREEYLEAWEFQILLEEMDKITTEPNRYPAGQCLRLLATTGCRRDEIRALLWPWIDWDRSKIAWPDTKTGAGHLHLNTAAVSILRQVQAHYADDPKEHVFRGLDGDIELPQATLYRAWRVVKARAVARGVDKARLDRLRPHDLRHSFASLGLSHGLTLEDVGRLLRHRDTRSTKRYARHLPSREIALAAQATDFLPIGQ